MKRPGSRAVWVRIQSLPLITSVTSGKLLNLSVPLSSSSVSWRQFEYPYEWVVMRIKCANIGTIPGFLEHSIVFAIISNVHSPPPRSEHGGFSSALEGTYSWKAVLFLCLRASRGKTDQLTVSRCLCVRNMGQKDRRCIQIQGVGGFLRSRLESTASRTEAGETV